MAFLTAKNENWQLEDLQQVDFGRVPEKTYSFGRKKSNYCSSSVHYLSSNENKAWKKKKSDLYRIWTLDLCDTGAALYQLS